MKKNILSKITFNSILKILTFVFFLFAIFLANNNTSQVKPKKINVYWFIPDGLRADRGQFNIFKWAENGELPNLRILMARGSYGYSRPVFPGHTPTNFATLLTGVNPDKHGIADGAMRTFGYPLSMVSKGGFSSVAKLVAPIWVELENADYLVSLQSVPGSTPPEIFKGNVIKGRWGGWGVEFPSMILQSSPKNEDPYKKIGNNRRVFTTGPELTVYLNPINTKTGIKYTCEIWGQDFTLNVTKLKTAYNGMSITTSDKKLITNLIAGEWSDWISIPLKYQLKNDYQISSPKKTDWENVLSTIEIDVKTKFKLISISENGEFRLRILFDSLNEYLTYPAELAGKLQEKIGPMVDFVDNYPPQLVYHPKDKNTFIEEAKLSWRWHQRVVPYLMNDLKSDFIIHSVYNPNQMLTSRWWLPYIDDEGYLSKTIDFKEKQLLWNEVKDMYREMDKVLGEIINNADEDTYIVLSSDHGVIPLTYEVRLNNLFAKKGWLKFNYNSVTKNYEIDWKATKVVFLQMDNIYINPKGLDGPYYPATGKEYNELRSEVIKTIAALKDEKTGKRALAFIWPREKMDEINMPKERVGDLVVSPLNGFSWVEDLSEDGIIFTGSLKGGYKQALNPDNIEGLLTPFVIAGPGIKANYKMDQIIKHVDQYATLAKITKIKHPTKPVLDGKIIENIFIK